MGERAAAGADDAVRFAADRGGPVFVADGQRHPLGGFVGEAEYEGELAEFLPYLRLGKWVGVGRQTVWGRGNGVLRLGF